MSRRTTVGWRRRIADAVGVAAIVAGALAVFPPSAAAGEQGRAAAATGWWYRDGNVPLVDGPEVTDGGMYVAADLLGEQAIAAIRVPLLEGDRPRSLQLQVASSSGSVDVQVCPTTSSWAATGGMGSYDDRPDVDCSRGVPAQISNGLLQADLQTLGAVADVDVAMVPNPGATFELVLDRPGGDAVIVDAPEPPTTTTPTTAPSPPPTTPVVTTPSVPPTRAPVPTTAIPVTTTTTQPVVAPPIPAALPPALPTTTVGLPPRPPASGSGTGTGQRFVAGGTFALLAALWAWLQFGGGARLIEPDHQMGIGRFKSDRPSDTPPRL